MEMLATLVVSALTAVLGGWAGYYLAKRQEDLKRTADISIEVTSGDFSALRTEFIRKIRGFSEEETVLAAKRDVPVYNEVRQAASDIFNRYDLICYLYNKGALNEELFRKYVLPTISGDYDEADAFFAALEADYKERGIKETRPFFPEIAKVAARKKG